MGVASPQLGRQHASCCCCCFIQGPGSLRAYMQLSVVLELQPLEDKDLVKPHYCAARACARLVAAE